MYKQKVYKYRYQADGNVIYILDNTNIDENNVLQFKCTKGTGVDYLKKNFNIEPKVMKV